MNFLLTLLNLSLHPKRGAIVVSPVKLGDDIVSSSAVKHLTLAIHDEPCGGGLCLSTKPTAHVVTRAIVDVNVIVDDVVSHNSVLLC